MKKKVLLSAVLLSLLSVQPLFAQDEKVSVQQRGENSVTLGVNYDRASIGYWHKLSDKNDLGIDFSLYYAGHQKYDAQRYALSPAVRHYLIPAKSISPYLYAGLNLSYGKHDQDPSNSGYTYSGEYFTTGVEGGIGLEWFPVQNISIGGHVGAMASYSKERNSRSDNFGFTNRDTTESFSVSTSNSGIRLNLFF